MRAALRVCALVVFFVLDISVPTSLLAFQTPTTQKTLTPGDLYKKASPSVVLIELYNDKGEVNAAGSGFLVSADGKILTNYHVIAHSKRATVRLANDDAYDTVEVLDFDKRKDIALVKIKAVDLPFLALGKSSAEEVGNTVYSLSNPLGGLQNTLSEGILSGIRMGDGYKYFQISAPISHGSSGGPLFNAQGEVIGITSASIEEGQNLNFAIPIDYARGLLIGPNTPKSLASIYEPEPQPKPESGPAPASAPSPADLPEEMKKSSVIYLESKIGSWIKVDADKLLGPSLGYREYRKNPNNPSDVTTDIYRYDDPTKGMKFLELAFERESKKLRNIYAYPWTMTIEEAKNLFGTEYTVYKRPDGGKFYMYKNRRLNVLTNRHGDVISMGVY